VLTVLVLTVLTVLVLTVLTVLVLAVLRVLVLTVPVHLQHPWHEHPLAPASTSTR
jgi:hypothetical protein